MRACITVALADHLKQLISIRYRSNTHSINNRDLVNQGLVKRAKLADHGLRGMLQIVNHHVEE
jgi:hypothetical protein